MTINVRNSWDDRSCNLDVGGCQPIAKLKYKRRDEHRLALTTGITHEKTVALKYTA